MLGLRQNKFCVMVPTILPSQLAHFLLQFHTSNEALGQFHSHSLPTWSFYKAIFTGDRKGENVGFEYSESNIFWYLNLDF